MFPRTFAITMLGFPLLAAATVITRTIPPTTPASQCTPGDLQCCNTTQDSNEIPFGPRTLLLSIISGEVLTGFVGITCSPLTIGGDINNSCTAKPVCCSDNRFKGLIALGCTPADLNL